MCSSTPVLGDISAMFPGSYRVPSARSIQPTCIWLGSICASSEKPILFYQGPGKSSFGSPGTKRRCLSLYSVAYSFRSSRLFPVNCSTFCFLNRLTKVERRKDSDSNERRWPAGNQPTDTPSVDKRRDEERGDRSRKARKGRQAGGGRERKKGRDRPANSAKVTR